MNKEVVQTIIALKQGNLPYTASTTRTETDMDVFPYPRFYRGDYQSNNVIIFEREAGFKRRHDDCYHNVANMVSEEFYPNHCWQAAPSTQYPCYPEYLRKYSDKKEMEKQMFRTNVNEYR